MNTDSHFPAAAGLEYHLGGWVGVKQLCLCVCE
jgi:hypothetical protein